MVQKNAEVLFEYLKSILFEQEVPVLEAEGFDEGESRLVQGMNLLNKWLKENQSFSENIATGRLNCAPPSKDNPICDPLKMLRSNLSHLVWQARQVAEGDYNQKVVMLGEFSDGFNTMIEQLKQREETLLEQNSHIREKAVALLESNELLSCITENMKDYIVVLDAETMQSVFENKAFEELTVNKESIAEALKSELQGYQYGEGRRFWEIEMPLEEKEEQTLFLNVHSFYIDWQGRKATAHLVADITVQKERESSIEYIANSDDLTGLFNRRYCMELLEEWVKKKAAFSICFADLDGLKYVNDTFGHFWGDNYLQAVSRVFKEVFRSSDAICRIGGDEFVIALENCPEKYTQQRMQRVYDRIAELSENNEVGYPMSISYGIYSCDADNKLTPEEILEQSDAKMYAFKLAHKKIRT